MKKLALMAAIIFSHVSAQTIYTRLFSQPPAANLSKSYGFCDFMQPVKTIDQGYLISANPAMWNIHNAYPIDFMAIKTNSLTNPVWKYQNCFRAKSLATGNLVIAHWTVNYYVFPTPVVQKITNSGQPVWTRSLSITGGNYDHWIQISDMAVSGNTVTFIGYDYFAHPVYVGTDYGTNGLLFQLDTATGAVFSQKKVASTNTLSASNTNFDKLSITKQGDYVIGDGFTGSIYKFSPTFSLSWAVTWSQSGRQFDVVDVHSLSNGDIFCLLSNRKYHTGDTNGILLKLNAQGVPLLVKEIDLLAKYKGMEKMANGNFVITGLFAKKSLIYDTSEVIVFSVDSNANFLWGSQLHRSIGVSKILADGSKLLFTSYYDRDISLVTGHINGNFPCASNKTLSITPDVLTLTSRTVMLSTSAYTGTASLTFSNISQTYRDPCFATITDIAGITDKKPIKVWPNPSTGRFFLELPDHLLNSMAEVYSAEGKLEGTVELKGNELILDPYERGLYFVRLYDGENCVAVLKIAVER